MFKREVPSKGERVTLRQNDRKLDALGNEVDLLTVPIEINGIEEYKRKLELLQEQIESFEKTIEELNEMAIEIRIN